ncbi:MAG: McrB family protein, partial [Clostridiaceae bacterium]
EKTERLTEKVVSLKKNNIFNYMDFIEEYKDEIEIYKVLLMIGELVAYIDLNAANKNEFNKYEDKRTIAKVGVYQSDWVIKLLSYKESENIDNLTGNIKNAIRYLIAPDKVLNIFSNRHRKLMGMFIFQNSNISLNFDKFVIEELNKLNINVKNKNNKPYIYERLLYSNSIKKIWEYNQVIWKISHGNIDFFSKGKKEKYLMERMIAVHKDTAKNQGEKFIKSMKKGDLFYLCYGGTQIKLIGKITSDVLPLPGEEGEDGWMKRNYKVIKESLNENPYKGVTKGWTPNYNSTCAVVKEEHLTIFEKELLIPYFNITLEKLLTGNIEDDRVKGVMGGDPPEKTKVFDDLNYIIYGPPGTGKTYNAVNYAVAMIENNEVETLQVEDYRNVKEKFEMFKSQKQIAFTTFHQSFGYEEFIEGIKPRLDNDSNSDLSYYISDGIFKELCNEAREHENKNYVFIIDEINRGNISKIFGELITLIEKSKRLGRKEEVKTKLPYSKQEFGVPENLFILGTMNTADRSIALLDTALRRRFEFIEMMPDTNVFKKLNNNSELLVDGINIKNMLDIINNRIEILYDREHTIGQAYFIDLINDNSIENLSNIFVHKIIPLLQEYFYDDYEKLRLILGDNQTENTELQFINVSNIPKNIFGINMDNEMFEDKKVYSINIEALTNNEAYMKIYNINTGIKKHE